MSDRTDTIDPNAAVDYIRANAAKYGAAKANRRYLEEFRKTTKALLMGECTEKAVNAREQFAYSHPDYKKLLDGLRVAIEVEETLAWMMRAAEIRCEIWRSMEASNRGLDRAAR